MWKLLLERRSSYGTKVSTVNNLTCFLNPGFVEDKVKEKTKAVVKPATEGNTQGSQAGDDNNNNNAAGNPPLKDDKNSITSEKVKSEKSNKTIESVSRPKTEDKPEIKQEEISLPLDKKNLSKEDEKDKESDNKDSDKDSDISDIQMKRRPSSPPSLSSSFNILPPIKKENEVSSE